MILHQYMYDIEDVHDVIPECRIRFGVVITHHIDGYKNVFKSGYVYGCVGFDHCPIVAGDIVRLAFNRRKAIAVDRSAQSRGRSSHPI